MKGYGNVNERVEASTDAFWETMQWQESEWKSEHWRIEGGTLPPPKKKLVQGVVNSRSQTNTV